MDSIEGTSLDDTSSTKRVDSGSTTGQEDSRDSDHLELSTVLDASAGASGMKFVVRKESVVAPPAPPDHLTDFPPAGNLPPNDVNEMSLDDFLLNGANGLHGEDDYILSSSESSEEDD